MSLRTRSRFGEGGVQSGHGELEGLVCHASGDRPQVLAGNRFGIHLCSAEGSEVETDMGFICAQV